MKNIVFAFLLVYLTPVANAENWQETLVLPELKIEIDTDSIHRIDSALATKQRWTFAQDQVFNGLTYRVSKDLIYTNCINNTRANVHNVLERADGTVVYDRGPPIFGFAPLRPGSTPEKVHFFICQKFDSLILK